MTSDHTKRQMLIDENVPKLIKSLTGFKETDENFRLCEEYAFSRIGCHRYLSVNSHAVRRRIDGLSERFMADNYTRFGERLKQQIQELINDPLCIDHYELDVQWSILQFLLDVSKNPVAALSENKETIRTDDSITSDDTLSAQRNVMMNDLVTSLMRHNISTGASQIDTHADESDLSDWSDEESNHDLASSLDPALNSSIGEGPLSLKLIRMHNTNLKPPQKMKPFKEFDASKALEWKEQNTQPSWWLNETNRAKVDSKYPAAKMCELFQIGEKVSTLSEWCLMREILWMLQLEPHAYAIDSDSSIEKYSMFFSLNNETDEITANPNISLASVTVEGIKSILDEFAEVMTMLYRFRKIFSIVFQHLEGANCFIETKICTPPYTIQCYANGLKEFLNVIADAIIKLEMEIIEQDPMEIRTIVYVYNELLPQFRLVKTLHDIHTKVYIDFKSNAGHVCVAHLLAGLLNEMDTTALKSRLNLAGSLFLVSIRFYLNTISTWLNEGRYDDWRNEFLIQRCQASLDNPTGNSYQIRSLSSNIPMRVQSTIDNSEIIKLLRKKSMDTGYIMNILYDLGKINEMKGASQSEDNDLSEVFLNKFWCELNKFRKSPNDDFARQDSGIEDAQNVEPDAGADGVDYFQELTSEADSLLAMVYQQYVNANQDVNEENDDIENDPWSSYQIFKRLNDVADFHLPLSVVIKNCIENMLKSRISVANTYVLRMFRDEYNVLDHIKNLQRVYLFGAGDLMLTFYSNLFKSMNDGENWNNSYMLTVQLDNILTPKYPDMHSLFSVQLTSHDSHTKPYLLAIKDITINYMVRDSIRDVIHEKSLIKYNAIFRFLLQVKWAIWTLETLKFPLAFKNRPPYKPLTMIDLIFKRLALVRNWIIYSIQCVHSHLMTFVIQSMGQQFLKKMEKADCLRDIIELHDSYIDTIYQHCFRRTNDASLRNGFEQLMNLVMVLHDEWNNLQTVNIDGDYIDGENILDISGTVKQIDIVESTYINCHCYIAETLSKEVYTKDRIDLASLSAAFNCSCPY